MLYVHRSNRADALVDALADRLVRSPLPDPMAAEQIAVQSRGMERWLSHQLAQRLGTHGSNDGVSANIEFPFPARILHSVLRSASGEDDSDDSWGPDQVVWPILELLPELRSRPAFRLVDGYLPIGDAVDRRTYGLARRIADLFDRYAMFRPEMVASWSNGDKVGPDGQPLNEDQQWQAQLWRQLDERIAVRHPAERFRAAVEALHSGDIPEGELPPRLAFFGTTALPPTYLQVVSALAQNIDVWMYVLAPSRKLWEDVEAAADGDGTGAGELVEPTHPLLTSCAMLARDFQTVLHSAAADLTGHDDFAETLSDDAEAPLLSRLQSDLLTDVDRGAPIPSDRQDDPEAVAARPPAIATDADGSVQLHACHGPARQVEVLHDVLLHLFEDDPDLQPRDVLVMTPDIEEYAPLIQGVFGHDRGRDHKTGRPSIPYALADRTLRRTNPFASALVAVLEAADGRAEASTLLDLVSRPPVRRRFRITEEELGSIHSWVNDVGIRWGIDGDHRTAHGQPNERHHTWRRGLDRLLVGVAMTDTSDQLFADVVPYDDMEGDRVELLDGFVAFCTTLFDVFAELQDPRPIDEWIATLDGVIDRLMHATRDDEELLALLRRALTGFVDASADAEGKPSSRPLSLDAVRALVREAGSDRAAIAGYETGAVTFCAMIPMRSIPHRVVCLLGMDDGAFPRQRRESGFDLLAKHPQLGDRNPADEDRLLFLEAVLAARDHLVITYTGRDQRTNERKVPAVPVGELLDVIDRATQVEGNGRMSQLITTEHPLQAFSPRNFTVDPERGRDVPLSFDVGQLAAARRARSGETERWRFFPEPLPAVEDDDGVVVELGDLRRLLRDPVRWLYTNRLGMWLREEHEQIEDTEPIEANNLESWKFGQSMLEARLEGTNLETWAKIFLARGAVPAGLLGQYEASQVQPDVEAILALIDRHRDTDAAPELDGSGPLPVEITVGERQLIGVLQGLSDGLLLQPQYSKVKAKHLLPLWVSHLVLSAAYPDAGHRCLLVGRSDKGDGGVAVTFEELEPEVASGHLSTLIDLYDRGRCEPLPLFANSSAAYVEKLVAKLDAGESRSSAVAAAEHAAKAAWNPNWEGWGGDVSDEHVAHCYGPACEFETILEETDFVEVALAVWKPIVRARVTL